MASATRPMETLAKPAGGARPGGKPDPSGPLSYERRTPRQGGFFAVYQKGRGFWTRLGTGFGAVAILLLTTHFVFRQLAAPLRAQPALLYGITAILLIAGSLAIWWALNRPKHADFLIATDVEMKKVNWTSRTELIGSTKVVIAFMFLVAIVLFVIDIIFGYIFWAMTILRTAPPILPIG